MASGTNIGSLFWSTGIDSTGLRRDSKKASSALSGLFNPAILGATALAGAILKAGDAALSFSRDFETAFAEVQTISETARENADAMRDSLLELTTKIPVQAVDATKALYQIVSAGFDGADAMSVLEVSAKAAIAGVSDTATAADTLTTIINAYGLEAGSVTEISDALFKTVELGKTTLSELGSSFSQVAGLGAAYKIELNDILAATAQLTSQGASTSEAITRIRGAIVALSKEFGPAVFEGRNLAEAFQFARDEADKAGKGYEEFFGRVEAVVGILGLTGDQLDKFGLNLDKINGSVGSTELALDQINKTFDAQYQLLKNNITVAFSGFGDLLKNSLIPLIKTFNESFSDENPVTQIEKNLIGLNSLILKLSDVNIAEEERRKIISEINNLYPDLLDGLSDEEIALSDITKRLKEYNLEQLNRVIIAKEQDKIDDAIGKKNEALIKQRKAEGELTRDLVEYVTELNLKQEAAQSNPAFVNKINDIFQSSKTTAEKIRQILEFSRDYTITMTAEERKRIGTSVILGKSLRDYALAENEIVESSKIINSLTEERNKIAKSLGIKTKEEEQSTSRRIDQIKKLNSQLTKSGSGKDGLVKIINLESLDSELKDLRTKLRQASKEDAPEIFVKIKAKESEIKDFINSIQYEVAKSKGNYNLDIGIKPIETPKLSNNFKVIKDRVKSTTLEVSKLNKKIKESNEGLKQAEIDKNEKLKDQLFLIGEIESGFSSIAGTIADSNPELAMMLDSLGLISNVIGNIASGNYIAAGLSVLQLLLSSGVSEEELLKQKAESVVSLIKVQNRQLEEQLRLLKQASGVDRLKAEQQTLELIKKQTEARKKQILDFDVVAQKTTGNFFGKTETKLTSKLLDFDFYNEFLGYFEELTAQGFVIQNMDEFNALVDEYFALIDAREELYEELTSSTASGIADSISDGLLDGKDSLADFADDFESLMKNAVVQSFKTQFLAKAAQGFFDTFGTLSEDGLTDDELQSLGSEWDRLINSTLSKWRDFTGVLESAGISLNDELSQTDTGLAGAIKREITEETAGLLLGRTIAIQVDLKEIQELNINQNEILLESSGYLQQIEINTRNLSLMPELVSEVQLMNVNLKNL